MDLDPKGANNQIKEVIDRQYANDEDEVVVCLDSNEETAATAAAGASTSGTQARRRNNSQFEPMELDGDAEDNSVDADNAANAAEVSI